MLDFFSNSAGVGPQEKHVHMSNGDVRNMLLTYCIILHSHSKYPLYCDSIESCPLVIHNSQDLLNLSLQDGFMLMAEINVKAHEYKHIYKSTCLHMLIYPTTLLFCCFLLF